MSLFAHLRDARAALATSQEPLMLHSSKNALSIYGVLWFVELDRQLRAEFPTLYRGIEVDAGDRADLAHAALRRGLKFLRFSGHPQAAKALSSIAEQMGATMIFSPQPD